MNRYSATLILGALVALGTGSPVQAQEPDQVTVADLANAKPKFELPSAIAKGAARSALIKSAAVQGIDAIQTFGGSFSVFGYDQNGYPRTSWSYNMIGNSPEQGGTTEFDAPIIPVSLLMLDANGAPRYVKGQLLYSDATQYVSRMWQSPVFGEYQYSSSKRPTQFIDSIQRAEFWSRIKSDDKDLPGGTGTGPLTSNDPHAWHTLFKPQVKTPRVMILPHGSYRFALNPDGSCCSFVLVDENVFGNLLYPPTYPVDGTTVIGAAEAAGDTTTKNISTFMFPNTYLFSNGDPNQCCILGFHSYDSEPGTAANGNLPRFYVIDYSSWISPGLFGAGFEDVTALSHELTETANDPFVDNLTPWWLAPNGNCQDDLETGDVIEGLVNATDPIKMNGYTYHPQNEALLQYFEFKPKSDAIDHAYSYPDITVLTKPSKLEKAGCTK